MRISDWSSDVCSSDLVSAPPPNALSSRMAISGEIPAWPFTRSESCLRLTPSCLAASVTLSPKGSRQSCLTDRPGCGGFFMGIALSAPLLAQEFETFEETAARSAEHTSELQSLMRISYAVFCL